MCKNCFWTKLGKIERGRFGLHGPCKSNLPHTVSVQTEGCASTGLELQHGARRTDEHGSDRHNTNYVREGLRYMGLSTRSVLIARVA